MSDPQLPPTTTDWMSRALDADQTRESARKALHEAGQRRRRAIQELDAARTDLLNLCEEIARTGLLPRTQIAEAADISRNKLYS